MIRGLLEAESLSRIYHPVTSSEVRALSDVSLVIPAGSYVVLAGPSGSGKSTVVRCLSRLVEPTAGEVIFDGDDLLKASRAELIEIRRHKMGMVFQHFGLMPHLTVLENVAFPLKVQGIGRDQRFARAQEMLDLVGLEGREAAFPRQLSGGQQQRVGIARSLAVAPAVWFLDEPFSALDPLIRRQMQDEFLRLQKLLHKTIVFITHDFLEALRLADRIAIMKDGEIVQIGTPAEVVMQPADGYVTEFTQDVPRVKVITAGDIMSAASNDTGKGAPVATHTTLEQLMSHFRQGMAPVSVAGDDGAIIGQVAAQDVLTALATTQDDEE